MFTTMTKKLKPLMKSGAGTVGTKPWSGLRWCYAPVRSDIGDKTHLPSICVETAMSAEGRSLRSFLGRILFLHHGVSFCPLHGEEPLGRPVYLRAVWRRDQSLAMVLRGNSKAASRFHRPSSFLPREKSPGRGEEPSEMCDCGGQSISSGRGE